MTLQMSGLEEEVWATWKGCEETCIRDSMKCYGLHTHTHKHTQFFCVLRGEQWSSAWTKTNIFIHNTLHSGHNQSYTQEIPQPMPRVCWWDLHPAACQWKHKSDGKPLTLVKKTKVPSPRKIKHQRMLAQQVIFFAMFSQPCCSAAIPLSALLSFTVYVLATPIVRCSQALGTVGFLLKSDWRLQRGNTINSH